MIWQRLTDILGAAAVEDTRQPASPNDSKPVQVNAFTNTRAHKKAKQHAGDNNANGRAVKPHTYNDSLATDESDQHLGDNNY